MANVEFNTGNIRFYWWNTMDIRTSECAMLGLRIFISTKNKRSKEH